MTTGAGRLSHRQRQAQVTRDVIAGAARGLFASKGYTATTIEAIAARADIPVPTIYSAFGTKPAILEEVRRLWIKRSDVTGLHAEALKIPEPRERLARAAHWTRRQFELGHDIVVMHQDAARADQRVAEAWKLALAGRQAAIEDLLRPISADFRDGLTAGDGVDLYVALTLPEVYRTLVVERHWSPDRYEAWLAKSLSEELLGSRTVRKADPDQSG